MLSQNRSTALSHKVVFVSVLSALLAACGSQGEGNPTDNGEASVSQPGSLDPTPSATASSGQKSSPTPEHSLSPEPSQQPSPSLGATSTSAPTPTASALPIGTPTPASPYIYTPEPAPEPNLSPDSLGPVITQALVVLLSMPAEPIWNSYSKLVETADREGCPLMLDYDYGSTHEQYWAGECTSAQGSEFSGVGYYYAYDNYRVDGLIYDGYYLYLSGGIEGEDGEQVEGSGVLTDLILNDALPQNYFTYYLRQVYGVFTAYNPLDPTAEVDNNLQPNLDIQASRFAQAETEAHSVTLEGGLSGLDGDIGIIGFYGVSIGDEANGSSCPLEPSGIISLRDNEGEWYDVVFDGPTVEEPDTLPENCDGCGDAWYRGVFIGQVCADFSLLTDWEGSPWL